MNYKQISKITMYSIIMAIFAVLGISLLAMGFQDWITYDSSYLQDPADWTGNADRLLPVTVEASRMWQVLSLVMCFVMSIAIVLQIKQMEEAPYKKLYVYSVGIFTWLLLPYTIMIGIKEKLYCQFLDYLAQDRNETLQMSFTSFKKGFTSSGKRDKLFWNTFFGYFLFLVTIVTTVLCLIIVEDVYPPEMIHPIDRVELKPGFTEADYYDSLKHTPIFVIWSTFTCISNFSAFIFMTNFIFFSRKIPFRNNTIMLTVSAYLTLVMLVYWVALFPDGYVVPLQWVGTIWTHAIVPVLFAIFTITSVLLSKSKPTSFKGMAAVAVPLPLFYGIYVYSFPFYTRWSVYGWFTNINPNVNTVIGQLDKETGEAIVVSGSYLMILAFFALTSAFVLFFFIHWKFANIVYKRSNREMKIAK
ncbi:MAG: hypothetical protein ACRCXE_01615 [Metamycoplasmataceae bacterium]